MALLEDAASWLAEQCGRSLSVKALWIPRGGTPREIDALIGRTVFRAGNEYGLTVRTESRDFIVSTEAMPEEPRKGDSFVWRNTVYEVLAPNGEPVWRWSDGYHNLRRIHTKEAGEYETEEEEDNGGQP